MAENVLKNKNYLLLFVGGVVSNLGTTIYNFAISLYIYVLTDQPVIAGLYLATGGAIYFAFSPFAGAIVDRLDKVKVVYITDFINGITVLSAGILIFLGLSNTSAIIMLFIVSIILGVNGSLFNPSAASLPPHILEENQLQQSSSLMTGMFALYQILGAVIGGFMYELLPISLIFIINGSSFIISGISETFITVSTKPLEYIKIHFKQIMFDIKEGVQYIFTLKPIFYLVVIASMLNFFTIPLIINGVPYLFVKVLEQEAYYMSFLNAMFPIGIIITSVVLGSSIQKEKVSPLIIRGMLFMGVFVTGFVYVTHIVFYDHSQFMLFMWIGCASLLAAGIFNGMINIPFNVAIQKTVEKTKLGRVSSVIGIISNGLTPIAIGLGGVVIQYLGVLILFYVAPIAMIGTALIARKNKYVNQL